MKANAPDKIYTDENGNNPLLKRYCDSDIEYVRKDAFIEKACEFLKSYRQDTSDGIGYIAGIINDKTIEDFKKYMEE